MPSPFPGSDPYLESAEWSSFQVEMLVNYRYPPDVTLDDTKQAQWAAERLAAYITDAD